ncbi:MAG: hypothetical protein JSV21_04000, partial [Nitrospirota bacterium]
MQDKVWQINDPTDKTQVIKRGQRPGTKSIRRKKDPAKAVSLSLLFWGGGQIYNDQVGRGVVFLLIMTAVYAGIAIFAFSWDTIVSAMDYESLPIDYIGIIFGVVFLFSIMLWAFNANQAYHKAVRINREPYGGTGNKVLPFVCSLVIPGWGQFLNGQDKKGSVF